MTVRTTIWPLLAVAALGSAAELERVVPQNKSEQTLVDSAALAAAGEPAYLAFPTLVRLDEREILVSYKRGRAHALDTGAQLEVLRFDIRAKEVASQKFSVGEDGKIYQMGEWIEFPSGRIGLFADVQQVVPDGKRNRHHRTGATWCVSDDRGRTFGDIRPMGAVDGVEYGYIFEGLISRGKTFMLAMAFPELTERKSFFDEDGKRVYGQVSVLVSADEGASWKHVRNLSREFGGIDINESSLVAQGDGFIVATRGYDGKARLHAVDQDFRFRKQRDLTSDHSAIGGVIGRPRLFWKDDALYLMGRNHPPKRGSMELALLRIDPESLAAERYVVLDPDEGTRVGDSYYAVPYFRDEGDTAFLNVITYRQLPGRRQPDIVRLEFPWSQIR